MIIKHIKLTVCLIFYIAIAIIFFAVGKANAKTRVEYKDVVKTVEVTPNSCITALDLNVKVLEVIGKALSNTVNMDVANMYITSVTPELGENAQDCRSRVK